MQGVPVFVIQNRVWVDAVNQAVYDLQIPSTELAFAYAKVNNYCCIGYICCAKDPYKKEILFKTIQETLQTWELTSLQA